MVIVYQPVLGDLVNVLVDIVHPPGHIVQTVDDRGEDAPHMLATRDPLFDPAFGTLDVGRAWSIHICVISINFQIMYRQN